MESLQHLQARRKAVANIGQITKAMEVVSATKMRRAQEVALNSRAYALTALKLLEKLSQNAPGAIPFAEARQARLSARQARLSARQVRRTLVMLVASDRGLAGSFNAQVFRATEQFLSKNQGDITFLIVGKKASAYAMLKKFPVAQKFFRVGDYVLPEEVQPIAEKIIEGYDSHAWDRVVVISTNFRTTLLQEVLVRELLPINLEQIRKTVMEIVPEHGRYAQTDMSNLRASSEEKTEYIFEPGPQETISALVPHLLAMQIYHIVLEANASEHSARRVAMKTASDNAKELSDGLRLEFNKARQTKITTELIEITSTQNAL